MNCKLQKANCKQQIIMSILFMPGMLLLFATGMAGAETLTLNDAVRMGLENNFDIRIARNSAEAADNTRKLKTGYLLPAVQATGTAGYRDTEYETPVPGQGSAAETYSAGASLSWTLFDGFRMFHACRLVERSATRVEEASRSTIETRVVQVISAYYNLVSARSLLDAARDQLAVSRRQLEFITARAEYGQATALQQLRQQVTVNTDSSAVAARELDAVTALHELNTALGREVQVPVTVETEISPLAPEHDVAYWAAKAGEFNAGLRMADLQRAVAAANRGIARAAFWPVLSATGSYTRTWADNDNTAVAAGLAISMPILAGFSRITNAQNAALEAENAELTYEKTQTELRAFIHQQWEQLVNAYGQVQFGTEAVELARKTLELSEEQYRLGGISDIQFREAQLALLNARVRQQSAVFRNRVLVVQLEQLAGVLKIE